LGGAIFPIGLILLAGLLARVLQCSKDAERLRAGVDQNSLIFGDGGLLGRLLRLGVLGRSSKCGAAF
jgi:hypothetical protein